MEASLGVIETPRIAAAALRAQSTLRNGLSSNDRLRQLAHGFLRPKVSQLAADHLSIDGAGDRELGAISLAICSEDPHRSLACT